MCSKHISSGELLMCWYAVTRELCTNLRVPIRKRIANRYGRIGTRFAGFTRNSVTMGDHHRMSIGNYWFSFFMAIGNILGYAAGSYGNIHKMFPFTETKACDVFCANLKTCFFLSIFLLAIVSTFALLYVEDIPLQKQPEIQLAPKDNRGCFKELLYAFHGLSKPMWMLMLVTAINWIAWFPFFLYNTDWMGHEVYGGKTGEDTYAAGVRAGTLGLGVQAGVLAIMSLAVERLSRFIGGAKRLWGIVNIILAIALAMTVAITKAAEHERHGTTGGTPSEVIKVAAFSFFAIIGIPLAINFSVPFALASIYSSTTGGAGQGLSLGVLNLAIVIPQIIVALGSGPWDALFGGGNLPAFMVGAVAAVISAVLAIVLLPTPKPVDMAKASIAPGGLH